MSSACSEACGFCGRCTAAWEAEDTLRPRAQTIEVICDQCRMPFELTVGDGRTRCRSCQALDALYAAHLKKQGAA